jgi:Kelch motif protein/galactose oxidase-like protein
MPPYRERTIANSSKEGVAEPSWVEPPIHVFEQQPEYELPFAAADAEGRLHYFAGFGSVFFDPRTQRWAQKESPLYHVYPADPNSNWLEGSGPSWWRRSAGAAVTGPDGRIFLVGGLGTPALRRGSDRDVLDGLDVYDPARGVWRRAASMTTARQSLAAAFASNGKLYVFGGCSCLGWVPFEKKRDSNGDARARAELDARRHAVASTEVYDPKTDTWSLAAPMPEPRMLMAAARGADGKIYVIGGQTSWGGTPRSDVDVYDPASDRWSKGPSLRIARLGHAAVATPDGTIWVLGGYAAAPQPTEGATASVELLRTSATH